MKDKNDDKTIDAFEKKPMTAAERKAKQRENMKGRVRLDCYISERSKAELIKMKEFGLAGEQTDAATLDWIIHYCYTSLIGD